MPTVEPSLTSVCEARVWRNGTWWCTTPRLGWYARRESTRAGCSTTVLKRIGSRAGVPGPLATVVVGGLVTSTTLTLLVIPALYAWFAPDVESAGEPTVKPR